MTVPLQERVRVLENVQIARNTWRIRVSFPKLAETVIPGQFVMVRLPSSSDPLLGRPFALYDTVLDPKTGRPVAVDIVYLVVGKVTSLLAQIMPDQEVDIWGPLGNGFPDPPTPNTASSPETKGPKIALVAGGIGQTPFLAHTRDLLGKRGYGGQSAKVKCNHVSLYYGIRNRELAAGIEDFQDAGADVNLSSDDGSIGFHGNVIQSLRRHPLPDWIVGCGPEPMLHALANFARENNVPCHVSLETPMACGLGICFSCVTKVCTPTGWDYQRVCVDGPIFDASRLVWD